VALASLMEKGPGLSLININIGAGSPDRPPLKNVHGFSLDDFIAFADKLEGFRPGCNNYRDRIIFSDNYLQTALYYRQSGDSRITDDVVVEVGRDLRSRGFTRSQVAASLRKVLTDERGRTPRAFLDPGGVREIAPKLRAAGIVPRGFLA